jgi:hypothetical protein
MWIYADDCDAAIERLREAGVAVVDEPADQPWGERMAFHEQARWSSYTSFWRFLGRHWRFRHDAASDGGFDCGVCTTGG